MSIFKEEDKGINAINLRSLSKYTSKPAKLKRAAPKKEAAKTVRVAALSELEGMGYRSLGTGIYKDATHHLWQVTKDAEGFQLVRNAEEEIEELAN